nr:zinc finger, CCHC-type [Tanacetum cinerariifolium]
SDKPKGNNVAGPSVVNMVEHNNSSGYNDNKGTEDSGDSVVSERVTNEIVQQSEPQLRKSKRHKTPKDFGPEFQLYLIEGTRDKQSDYSADGCEDSFLNGELEEEVYINQPLGFIMPVDKCVYSKFDASGEAVIICLYVNDMLIFGTDQVQVDLTKEFLSSRFSMKDMGEADVILVDKCVYSKFDASGEAVIICLYVNDMLIFGTDQVQVDLTKEFLSSRFSMKDMGEADVILAISQSHYIKKVLKKFNYSDCTPVSTSLDTCEKLMPNRGLAVSQLEYSRVIGCLMYAMTCTRLDIAFPIGKLSRYTSNPGTQHWQANQRVQKYLKKTMDYRLVYSGYPSVLEGYTDASWISNTKDNSSTSGWVFLLGGGEISCASKKQICITGSTMESEFVALTATGKEAGWLKNLLLEIPL